jgi:deazaflavin-dependent oxidoreductase (nitroreductase family)
MTKENQYPDPPKGLSRILYRFPILMYQTGLGILMGKRFLLLEHTGRKSGLPRKAVLEVIRYDETQEAFFVVSAFGDRADWYRNISKEPMVRIQVGWKWMPAHAEGLGLDQTQEEILDYARRHPKTFRVLVERLLGYELGESDEDLVDIARKFIVVRISPGTSEE